MPSYSARRSLHSVGPLQRDGDLGRPADRGGAYPLEPRAALLARMARICAAVPRGGRARPAPLLRRFRRSPSSSRGPIGDGGVRQRADAHHRARSRVHSCRCRSSGRMTRFTGRSRAGARVGNRPLPRRRACQRRRGRGQGTYRCRQPSCSAFGIATECGMARARSDATVRSLLDIHARVCGGG